MTTSMLINCIPIKIWLRKNWCSTLYGLICTLGFNDAWLFQDIRDSVLFVSLVNQWLKRSVYTNLEWRIEESSGDIFYKHISSFGFQPYINILNITKFRNIMSKLRVSLQRLSPESGRLSKPNPHTFSEIVCLVICWKMTP